MSLSHHPNIVRNGLVAYFDAANPKSYPAGQDPYVSGVNLLFDGESLVDKSAKTQSFTNNSSVTVSTTQKKFGNSSLYFSGRTADGGSNSYLSFAANSDFGFGSGDWTVETWFYKTTPLASLDVLFDNRVGLGGAGGYVSGVALYVQAGVVKTGNNAERLAGATIATGVWNHLMISRSGNNIYLGVNGTVVSTAFSTTLHSAPQLYIGNSVVSEYAGGYMDDYRVTKGFARYTANYTVPTLPNVLTGTVTDLTKNKYLTTLTSGPTYSNNAINLSGTSQYLAVNGGMPSGTSTAFTFECWVRVTDLASYRAITRTAGGLDIGVVQTTGAVTCDQTAVTNICITPSGAVVAGVWTHIAVTRTTGNLYTIYINGISRASGTNAFTVTTATTIGFSAFSASHYFKGAMSIIKNYSRDLSANEILQNYNATKSRYG